MNLFSIAYLPPVEYLQLYLQSEQPYIEKCENYVRQTYRNRCLIASANGVLPLIVPVKKNHLHNCPITQIEIDYSQAWQIKHWRAFEAAYNISPFFLYYKDFFEPFYFQKNIKTLWEFNLQLFDLILKLFNIPVKYSFTDVYISQSTDFTTDYRQSIHPKSGDKTGQKEHFFPIYSQVFAEKNGFFANLSCIDLLFNTGNLAKEKLC